MIALLFALIVLAINFYTLIEFFRKLLGPRIDKFDRNGKPNNIYGHDLPLSVLGAMILWLGWYGFNGGSTLSLSDNMPLILVNTSLSASTGGVTSLVVSWVIHNKRVRVEDVINGVVGGLVGITAGCHAVSTEGASLIGIVCGILTVASPWIIENIFKLDDVVGAFTVHSVCGIWGTLAVPLFATDPAKGGTFIIQLLGVATCFVWAFGLGLIVFFILKLFKKLRVSPESERKGLNIAEHGAKTTWLDLISAMSHIAEKKGLPGTIEEETATEAGMIAGIFNRIIGNLREVAIEVEYNSFQINDASIVLKKGSDSIFTSITDSSGRVQEITSILENIRGTLTHTKNKIEKMQSDSNEAFLFSGEIKNGFDLIESELKQSGAMASDCFSKAKTGEQELTSTVQGMKLIQENSAKVAEILDFLTEISDQLNMLSLNASIEAARSGIHGQGFAIVAGEMNKLAEITKVKTKKAGEHIRDMEQSLETGRETLHKSVMTFQLIKQEITNLNTSQNTLISHSKSYRGRINSIISFLKQLSQDSDYISENIHMRAAELDEVYEAINDISASINDLHDLSEHLKNTSAILREQSKQMNATVHVFNPDKNTDDKNLLN